MVMSGGTLQHHREVTGGGPQRVAGADAEGGKQLRTGQTDFEVLAAVVDELRHPVLAGRGVYVEHLPRSTAGSGPNRDLRQYEVRVKNSPAPSLRKPTP
jgi:hypothetical protein